MRKICFFIAIYFKYTYCLSNKQKQTVIKAQAMSLQAFNANSSRTHQTDLSTIALDEDEPRFNVRSGMGNFIISAPHSGWKVPQNLIDKYGQPLGVPAWWFDPKILEHRHEVCDWGTAELVDRLHELNPHISSITSNVSRLVIEKNRLWDHAITPYSAEYDSKVCIPANHGLSDQQLAQRQEIYDDHAKAVNDLITRVKGQHAESAIYLDIHSFSPTWHGHGRDHEIGITYFEDNPLAEVILETLNSKIGDRVAPQYPYNLLTGQFSDKIASPALSEKHNIWFIYIEIRNDLLQDPKRLEETAQLLSQMFEEIQRSPKYNKCLYRQAPQNSFTSPGIFTPETT